MFIWNDLGFRLSEGHSWEQRKDTNQVPVLLYEACVRTRSKRAKGPLEVHHLLLLTTYRGVCGSEI